MGRQKVRIDQLVADGDEGDVPAITGGELVYGPPAGGSATVAGTPPLAGADDYEFDATSTSLPAGWSWEQQGSSTWQERYDVGCLVFPNASFNYVRGIYRSLPGTFNRCTLKFAATSGTGNEGPGIFLRNSSSGKIAHMTVRATSHLNLTYFSTATGTVGTDNDLSAIPPGPLHGGTVMSIVRNSSTSWDFKWGPSYDALGTFFAAQDVTAATQGFTPDQIGFGYLCIGGGPKAAALDWIKFE